METEERHEVDTQKIRMLGHALADMLIEEGHPIEEATAILASAIDAVAMRVDKLAPEFAGTFRADTVRLVGDLLNARNGDES